MEELNLKLPINITSTPENGGYVITDAQNSEFFFYTHEETGELVYDGCCTEVENMGIVLKHLGIENDTTKPLNQKK